MITTLELNEIKQYVLRELPRVLEQDPQFITFVNGMLNGRFPNRDEFARLLDEVKLLREDTNRRFEQMQEQIDRRFEEARQERLYMRRDIAKIQAGQVNIIKRLDHQEAWFKVILGEGRRDKGKDSEDLFAVGLSYGLKNPDITSETIRLRQKLVDTDGLVFKKGYETEVDIIAEDGKLIVFEVKTTARPGDVGIFALKVELVTHQNPDKKVEGVLISVAAEPEIRERCHQYNLRLVE
ncbi:MAG: hypothetical protein B6242_13020 [Anaerolineaceae bacterium 4572_78]|nr:MAG: hypothetical protein B6242_13020 [Anaerolineaceae bacterium 4572_78]